MDELEPILDSAYFRADDLRSAAESSPNPAQYLRTAAWAIKSAHDTGAPDDVADEYFRIVASRFV